MPSEITAVQKIQEVSALLTIPNSRIMAGGTTLSADSDKSLHMVDIRGLEGLDGIKQKGTRIEIGPLTTLSSLADSMLLQAYVPALAEAAGCADAAIVEQGTLGGSLAAARIGDAAVALLASGAKLTIKTDSDFREILVDRFWPSGGGNDLDYDEWITRITIQIPKETLWGDAFGRIGKWDENHFPAASAAVRLAVDESGKITAIRGGLCLGARHIRRMFPLEKALKGKSFTEENTEKAAKMMTSVVRDQLSEEELSGLLRDLLQDAFAMAEERRSI